MADAKITASEAAQWRAIGAYSPAQAACLLLDLPPGDADEWALPPAAAALEAQIRAHYDLAPNTVNATSPKPRTITQAQLVAFAASAGLQSKILGASADTLDPRRETTLLLVIAALLQMAKLPDGAPFKAADAIVAQLSVMGLKRDRKAIAAVLKDAESAR